MKLRGQAAVEMAVTLVLLIPLIMYTIFLQEMLNYTLEAQEPTVTAAWDYSTIPDYTKHNGAGIERFNKLKYCDHSSAFDSYDVNTDCNGAHHYAAAVHQCWLSADSTCTIHADGTGTPTKGQQLQCSEPEKLDLGPFGSQGVSDFADSDWYRGGVRVCSDRLGVINYFLPEKFMEQFSKVDVTDHKKSIDKHDGSSVHGSDLSNTSAVWLLEPDVNAIDTDGWSLGHTKAIGPNADPPLVFETGKDKLHPVLDRTAHYFKTFAGSKGLPEADDWHRKTEIVKMLHFLSQKDGVGDHLSSPPVLYKPAKEREGDGNNRGFFASGWKDQRQQSFRRVEYPWPR
jgi:hypothetical protein